MTLPPTKQASFLIFVNLFPIVSKFREKLLLESNVCSSQVQGISFILSKFGAVARSGRLVHHNLHFSNISPINITFPIKTRGLSPQKRGNSPRRHISTAGLLIA